MTLLCRYNLNLSLDDCVSAHVGLGIATAKHSTPDSKARRELARRRALVERVDRTHLVK